MSLLQLENVSARYQSRAGQQVLHEVSLSISPGEAWVVLGPNGAGKSTLVRLAMGLLRASSGQVRVCGRDPASAGPQELAKSVAWVPQTIDDETGFTGLELVLMGRAPHLDGWGVPSLADEARARAVMAELEVTELAGRALSEVSGGERRRVWLARALVQDPKLLVLDEPTAFLDVKHQLDSLRAVSARVREGLAVLAVLHDVNLARLLATHVVLLKAGRVLAAGPVHEVLTAARLTELYGVPMIEAATPGGSLFVPEVRGG